MKKHSQNRRILAVTLAVILLCLAGAFAPLWMNQCAHRLTETEINLLMQPLEQSETTFATGTREEIIKRQRNWLTKSYVPCGVGSVSPEVKQEVANNYAGLFDDQLYLLPLPALRIDLDYIYLDGSTPKYYFQAYTFFHFSIFCVRSILPGRLLEFYDSRCPKAPQ